MERCGQLPEASLADNVSLIEDRNKMKEEIKSKDKSIKTLTQENESLRSADTAIILYESKFKELNEKDQKKDTILKGERDKNQEQELKIKAQQQTIQNTQHVNEQKDAEIRKINAEKKELARRLAEAEKMLAQTSGHQVMTKQIDKQKKTTRDALSYVAELKRERSIFASPRNTDETKFDS